MGPLGWLAPRCALALPRPPQGLQPGPGPTWGPEVQSVHTCLMDFCSCRGAGAAAAGGERRGLSQAHTHVLKGGGHDSWGRGVTEDAGRRADRLQGGWGRRPGPDLPSSWASSEVGAAGSEGERGQGQPLVGCRGGRHPERGHGHTRLQEGSPVLHCWPSARPSGAQVAQRPGA